MDKVFSASIMGGEPVKVPKTAILAELAAPYADRFKNPIVLALVNNEIQELHKTLSQDSEIKFLDITDPSGFRAYQRSIALLMIYAAKSVLGRGVRVIICHSLNKNYYCEIEGFEETVGEYIEKIQDVMTNAVKRGLEIEKMNISVEEAAALSLEFSLYDKIEFLKYRRASQVNFYKIDWFYDYFYGQMVPGARYLDVFRLVKADSGFILQFPSHDDSRELNPIKPSAKLSQIFSESRKWSKILKVSTVAEVNNIIASGGFGNFIRICEALHEKKISVISEMIREGGKKIILIAGPSSSGKTTFANRLSIQMRASGQRPHIISLDNYFHNRECAPLDEFGKPDYESFDYMNTKQLNEDLTRLLNGDGVNMPRYNFIEGRAEYKGDVLKLTDNDVIILEGIHALNEKLTFSIPRDKKFKIFISALTQLSIDDHNRIPTTDTRLLRRIVRDKQSRGMPAQRTIGMWYSVLRGEEKHIFPYQEEADVMFNSALVYEMCVLKIYAEPLLFGIEKALPQYTEARRLIKFLDSFLAMNSDEIPNNSIIREFIGGSCFDV